MHLDRLEFAMPCSNQNNIANLMLNVKMHMSNQMPRAKSWGEHK